jgi:hypothetical protein
MFELGVMESPSLRVSMGFLYEAIMIEKNKKLMEDTKLFEEEYEAT